MSAINPLAPFFPDYLSFIIYGLVTGGGLWFGRVAKRHVVLMMVYLPLCVFWLFVMWAFMRVQPESRQIWFFVGLIGVFMKPFAMLYALFGFIFERVMERIQEARQERREPPPQGNQGYQQGWSNADILAEQARREAEAKAHRARQQGQSGFQSEPPPQDRIKDKSRDKPQESPTPPQSRQSSHENRSYEQVLGLPIGWT